jgi:hypothetical protein
MPNVELRPYLGDMTAEQFASVVTQNFIEEIHPGTPFNFVMGPTTKILDKPAEMIEGDFGPYCPDVISAAEIRKADSRFPSKYSWLLFFSTDHTAGDGGIYLYLCNGDPLEASSWVSYTDAVAAGDFDYLDEKPTANPIFLDLEYGYQSETPCVNVVDGKVYMTYHNAGNVTYSQARQNTCLAISEDGINYYRHFNSKAEEHSGAILTYDPEYYPGDGHTGYFSWCANPIVEINSKYIGYSLFGGAGWGYGALWTSDNAIDWGIKEIIKPSIGLATEHLTDYTYLVRTMFSPKNIRRSGMGSYTVLNQISRIGASGTMLAKALPCQMVIESDGVSIKTAVRKLLDYGEADTYNEGNIGTPIMFGENDEYCITYCSDKEHLNSIAISALSKEDTTYQEIFTYNKAQRFDFTKGSLPDRVTVFGASSIEYTSRGIKFEILGGTQGGVYVNNPVKTTETSKAAMRAVNFKARSTGWYLSKMGLFQNPEDTSADTHRIALTSLGSSTNTDLRATVETADATASQDYTWDKIGSLSSYSSNLESQIARTSYGVYADFVAEKAYVTSMKATREEMPSISGHGGETYYAAFFVDNKAGNTATYYLEALDVYTE